MKRMNGVLATAAACLLWGAGPAQAESVELDVAQSTTSMASSITSSANPEAILRGKTSAVSATVLDQFGASMGGVSVSFSMVSGPGSIGPASGTTDSSGSASTTYAAPWNFPGKSILAVVRSCIVQNGLCSDVTITIRKH